MVDTDFVNAQPYPHGNQSVADERPPLPDVVTIPMHELQQFPSPGTQRALKAQTGRDYLDMVGPNGNSPDRTQTQVWTHLRKTIPGLRWDACEDVALQVDDEAVVMDPTKLAAFGASPPSAASGE